MAVNFKKKATYLAFRNNIKIISEKEIKRLINDKENRRICLHKKINDRHQEMFIFQKKKNFFPPKKNLKSDQSFFIIKGKLLILVFNNKGKIRKKIILKKNGTFYARIKKNIYHCDIPISKYSIHLETKNCIFKKNINRIAKFKFCPKSILKKY